jgi:hypothetical protein
MNHKIISIFTLVIVTICGCKKNEFRRDEYDTPTGKAFLKVAYFSADSVERSAQIYINNEIVSNTIVSHTPYPGGGYNTKGLSTNGYLAVDPGKGTATFKFVTTVPGSNVVSKELFTVTSDVTANIQQVVFISDTAEKTNALTVKTQTDRPDSGFVKMQFLNIIPNSGPISFYYKDSLVAANIKYREFVDFKTLPLYSTTLKIYSADTIPTSTSVPIASYTFSGIGNQKIYTALGRGYLGVKTTDLQRVPKVSLVIVK